MFAKSQFLLQEAFRNIMVKFFSMCPRSVYQNKSSLQSLCVHHTSEHRLIMATMLAFGNDPGVFSHLCVLLPRAGIHPGARVRYMVSMEVFDALLNSQHSF